MAACVVSSFSNSLTTECEEIYRACKGFGADEEKIIQILASKNSQQRKELREMYFTMFKKDLCKLMEKELHGKLEKAIVLRLHDPAERDAIIARTALEGWCRDDRALTEIICTRSSSEIARIREAYLQRYQKYLEEDVACKTKGPFQKLLLALLKGAHRCECNGSVDKNEATYDAKRLYEAGEGKCGIDDNTIIKIFSERSIPQLCMTFSYYKGLYGHDIMKTLHKETEGEFQEALRVIIKSIYVPAKYFAKVLRKAMKGLINDELAIARVMVTRTEVDMDEIKMIFERKYKMSLEQAFHKELSGHFKSFCLNLATRGRISP